MVRLSAESDTKGGGREVWLHEFCTTRNENPLESLGCRTAKENSVNFCVKTLGVENRRDSLTQFSYKHGRDKRLGMRLFGLQYSFSRSSPGNKYAFHLQTHRALRLHG